MGSMKEIKENNVPIALMGKHLPSTFSSDSSPLGKKKNVLTLLLQLGGLVDKTESGKAVDWSIRSHSFAQTNVVSLMDLQYLL